MEEIVEPGMLGADETGAVVAVLVEHTQLYAPRCTKNGVPLLRMAILCGSGGGLRWG